MSEKNSRVNSYMAVTGLFCALVAIISAVDPVPALRTPMLIACVVVFAAMAFLLGKEAKAQKNPEKGADRQS
ncbi:hypothetical protein ACWFMI_04445 [Nocardiopsis terrae]